MHREQEDRAACVREVVRVIHETSEAGQRSFGVIRALKTADEVVDRPHGQERFRHFRVGAPPFRFLRDRSREVSSNFGRLKGEFPRRRARICVV